MLTIDGIIEAVCWAWITCGYDEERRIDELVRISAYALALAPPPLQSFTSSTYHGSQADPTTRLEQAVNMIARSGPVGTIASSNTSLVTLMLWARPSRLLPPGLPLPCCPQAVQWHWAFALSAARPSLCSSRPSSASSLPSVSSGGCTVLGRPCRSHRLPHRPVQCVRRNIPFHPRGTVPELKHILSEARENTQSPSPYMEEKMRISIPPKRCGSTSSCPR